MAGTVRLQKFLANAGVAARRKAEELILAGRVTVNGRAVVELGTRIDPELDRVAVDARPIALAPRLWIALHKPAGYLTSRGDPHGRPTLYELLPPEHRGLFYVGRLDFDSEGLVLLTNDGDLAHRLQHPRFQVPRVYDVTIAGSLDDSVCTRLLQGVELEDGPARLVGLQVLQRAATRTSVRVTLAEGRKREVRRLFAALGHAVLRLCRISYGSIELAGLKPGAWRPLTTAEIASLERQ